MCYLGTGNYAERSDTATSPTTCIMIFTDIYTRLQLVKQNYDATTNRPNDVYNADAIPRYQVNLDATASCPFSHDAGSGPFAVHTGTSSLPTNASART